MASHMANHLSSLVGANIAAARAAAGLTQQQLAAALDTSSSRVSGWERGVHLPSQKQQPAIADLLFGGDISALFASDTETEGAAA
jgi:transcriptional regulator with XRE-family HTH domain